jgi:hypothetical protein
MVEGILCLARNLLYDLFKMVLSEEAVKALLEVEIVLGADNSIPNFPWNDYNILNTIVLSCAKRYCLVHVFGVGFKYRERVFDHKLLKIIQECHARFRAGHIE